MNEEQLPQTQEPSVQRSTSDKELDTLKFWQEQGIFQKSLEKTKDGEAFVFYDGPPFATGTPHYGSILPSVLKDAFPRYQTMKGRYVRRRWGWDCHGLPIENIVEQKLKISGKKQIEELGVDKFNQACRENILQYANDWKATIDRVARWVEFDNAYMTMQTSYMESVWWAVKSIWDKGLIYEDRKVLLYCARCETPVSNFEVAMDNSYREVSEESVFAKFKLLPRQRIIDELTDDSTFVLAWTTTPWTLPGNTALNIGPDIRYVLVKHNDEKLILAKERLEVLDGPYEIIKEFEARSIEGLQYEPLFPGIIEDPESRAHRIYIEDFVTTSDGTGIVHNAAMYGEVDYQAAKKRNLPKVPILDSKGQLVDALPENLRGLFFKDADKVILDHLKTQNRVYKTVSTLHSYPFCWRCGTPLFYNALSAWFINIQRIKQRLLELNQTINWYPDHLKNGRFAKGIESAPDWNISRNRYWATPLPFWRCSNEDCKEVVCYGSISDLKANSTNFNEVYPNYNTDAVIDDINIIDLHKPYIDKVKTKCQKCGQDSLRIPEVIDCWVESGSMPFAELHYPFQNSDLFEKRFPSDFVVEYIPQTRAWFYCMHVISTILFDRSPFKNVLTTGTILAEDGSKMSKSKNNYPDPNLVLERFGADALRMYLLTSPVVGGEDINFSEVYIDEVNKKVTQILSNVLSFYQLYSQGQISLSVTNATHILDKWLLARLRGVGASVTNSLDTYSTPRAGKALIEFISDFSTWYVRRSRERIKLGGENAQNALAIFRYALEETSKLLAPFMPYLAERIYKTVSDGESVHLAAWSEFKHEPDDQKLLQDMELVRQVVETGLSLRKATAIKVRQPLSKLEYHITEGGSSLASDLEQIIAEELNVKVVQAKESIESGTGIHTKISPALTAALFTHLTPELKQEGKAREIERFIQDLRKESGLSVGEFVDIYYNTTDPELEKILIEIVDRKKTYVNQISKSFEIEVDYEIQTNIDGNPLWIGLVEV